KEKAKAAFKAKQLRDKQHIKFDQKEEDAKMAQIPQKRPVVEDEQAASSESGEESNDVESENEEMYGSSHKATDSATTPATKKQRLAVSGIESPSPSVTGTQGTREGGMHKSKAQLKAERRTLKNLKKDLKQATSGTSSEGTPRKRNRKGKGKGK